MFTSRHQSYKGRGSVSTRFRFAKRRFIPRRFASKRYQPLTVARVPRMIAPRGPSIVEVKSWDYAINDPIVSVGGSNVPAINTVAGNGATNDFTMGMCSLVCGIQQGPQYYQRIGTKINVRSIQFKLVLQWGSVGGDPSTTRLMLLYDKQPNGAYPAIGDIIHNNDATVSPFGGIAMVNRSRFDIIKDKVYCPSEAANPMVVDNIFVKGNWAVEYGTNTGLIGDVRSGNFLAVMWALADTAAENNHLMSCNCRIRYYD